MNGSGSILENPELPDIKIENKDGKKIRKLDKNLFFEII